jgi:excisionase family DNA binding protein
MAAKKIAEEIQFMSLRDVAEKTCYHLKTIERLAREGKLKTVKIRGKRLVTLAYLKEFLESSVEDGKLEF